MIHINTLLYYLVLLQLIKWTALITLLMKLQVIIIFNNIVSTIYVKYKMYLDFCNGYHLELKMYWKPFCKLLKKLWGKPATCWLRFVISFYISNKGHFSPQHRSVIQFEAIVHTDFWDFLGCYEVLKLNVLISIVVITTSLSCLSLPLDDHQ